MSFKPEYLKLFITATEKAAYGASKYVGKNLLRILFFKPLNNVIFFSVLK